ncbi:UDP-N-acetylmuramate--L-alanine ligase [Alpinimonas psychrophila]|uniref:UDP-N-acetylmuramate--L-alanine ligase n=1 Tax=Alpinimonas psychrophila TaxID=748908 RepID=A0A7W3PNL4_9MICO|nr:UDP-N-acetylmuramate--alanine ligase [Alpinimonas psychrophila]
MIKPESTVLAPETLGTVHFVGIGGSGMSGIARLFVDAGLTVTGSDIRESHAVSQMRDLGIPVAIGHDAANLGDADTVVVTGALWENNPEYLLAREKNLPILHRSRALEWLTRGHRLISVAGAHGKTTSTGMIVTGLRECGEDPSFVNGGVIQSYGVSADSGSGDLFVVEADESDGSFLLYNTAIAVITNVDADHLDHYGTREAFDQAFVDFANAATDLVVISSDDPGAVGVTQHIRGPRVLTFGESSMADVRLSVIDTSGGPVRIVIEYAGGRYEGTLLVPGHHNALNAAGAFAALVGVGIDPAAALAGIARFGGTERRFELHDTVREVSVFDDYAHHHTEVNAVLRAARTVVGAGRLIAVHQPHLYSRTQLFAAEFAHTLENDADLTIVLDVYGAREDPIQGVTGALVSDHFSDPNKVACISDWQDAADAVAAMAQPGDFVITLGCGDVYRIIPQILAALESTPASTISKVSN